MERPKRPSSTPEWVMDFAKAICPESPDLLLSTDEKNILTAATQKILDLEAQLQTAREALEWYASANGPTIGKRAVVALKQIGDAT